MLDWTDKQNGVDTIDADDINSVAHAVETLETDYAAMKTDITELNKLPAKVSALEAKETIFANALKGNKTNSVISIVDVSPIEHTFDVNIASKNLLPFPYVDTTKTENGITFTVNSNGTITVNGTATDNATFILAESLLLPAGPYAVRGGYDFGSGPPILLTGSYGNTSFGETGGSTSFTVAEKTLITNIHIVVYGGVTVENIVLTPQIENGSKATSYTPYITSVEGKKVTVCGKNLFDMENMESGTINATTGAMQNEISSSRSTDYIPIMPNTTYTWSGFVDAIRTHFYDVNKTWISSTNTNVNGHFVSPATAYYIKYSKGTTVPVMQTYSIQLEIGSEVTDFEPFKEFTEYTSDTDGTVDNVKSLYPSTILFVQNGGVIISCKYNRDINKAFAALEAAIVNS